MHPDSHHRFAGRLLGPLLLASCLLSSCAGQPRFETVVADGWPDLAGLPADSGGQLRAFTRAEDPAAPNGYYLYEPAGHSTSSTDYPLLVFLHGRGEMGDSRQDRQALKRLLYHGPPRLIFEQAWEPPVPFFVLAPQAHPDDFWDGVPELVERVVDAYPIDRGRIYLTGLSMGGYATWAAAANFGEHSVLAAIVPICGGLDERFVRLDGAIDRLRSVPAWAFHGARDTVVLPRESIRIAEQVNATGPPVPVKLTLFQDLAHNAWTAVYDSDFTAAADPRWQAFDQDIYSWLLRHQRVRAR